MRSARNLNLTRVPIIIHTAAGDVAARLTWFLCQKSSMERHTWMIHPGDGTSIMLFLTDRDDQKARWDLYGCPAAKLSEAIKETLQEATDTVPGWCSSLTRRGELDERISHLITMGDAA